MLTIKVPELFTVATSRGTPRICGAALICYITREEAQEAADYFDSAQVAAVEVKPET